MTTTSKHTLATTDSGAVVLVHSDGLVYQRNDKVPLADFMKLAGWEPYTAAELCAIEAWHRQRDDTLSDADWQALADFAGLTHPRRETTI